MCQDVGGSRASALLSCDWHDGDKALEGDDCPACPNCGRMLATKTCEVCRDEFLDWEWQSADDVMASPCGDSRGDLCSSGCIQSVEAANREAEEDYDEWYEDWMDYEPDDVP